MTAPRVDHAEISARVVGAVGEAGARELLDAVTRPEAYRAALIGRLAVRDDAAWLAEVLTDLEEVLTDLEVDEVARLHMVEALRRVIGAS
jgi:hypothetical protein